MQSSLRRSSFMFILVLGSASAVPAQAQDPYGTFIAASQPKTPAEELRTFHLPSGFHIELVASEPDIIKPINMNFDARGRLWLTQSIEYPFPAPPTRQGRDTIKIIDQGRVSTYAGGLNIPIGVLPLPHGALVYSIPSIYCLCDTDGTRGTERKAVLGSFGFRDTHGMTGSFTWGFDGWVYACHGYSNTSNVRAKDGSAITMNSGNTYRFKPEGRHVEQFTHGQVNPFGLCFDPLGNLYSADCHTRPVMMLLRGAFYESFGKPHDGLGYAPEMCNHDHGSTAICGIVYYCADQFPPEYRDRVYMGNVVTNRINQDTLERHGSTYKAVEQPDFLVSDDPWFRPVDLKLGPDGAIYVADFYNRIIGHYEVPLTHPGRDHERGRIWRISYKGPEAKPLTQPTDLTKASVSELVETLSNPNLTNRMLAANKLVEKGTEEVLAAVRGMIDHAGPNQRVHGLWILERLKSLDNSTLAVAAKDADRIVRVHAMRILAERPKWSSAERALVLDGLQDADPLVERCAVDAVGVHPSVDNLPPLLALRNKVSADDTHLLYVVRASLRNQLLSADAWSRLDLGALSEKDRRAIADVATGVHASQAATFLLNHLRGVVEPEANVVRYVHHVSRYGNSEAMAGTLTFAVGHRADDLKLQAEMFRAIQQGIQERGGKLDEGATRWVNGLAKRLLESKTDNEAALGADLAGSMHLTNLAEIMVPLALARGKSEAVRRSALSALLSLNAQDYTGLLARVLDDTTETVELRQHIAGCLAAANRPECYQALLKVLAVAPAPLQNAIAQGLSSNAQGTRHLLDAVAAGKASARLLQDWIVHIRLNGNPEFKERLAKLTAGLPPADKRLEESIQKRRQSFLVHPGQVSTGALVFEKNCAICHQLGGKGAKVGPQLDGVGARGLDRLLEDIIDPNRNVDQAFRATNLLLKSGQALTGLVLREEGEVIILADAQGKEVRIPKNAVEERIVSQLSPMPANFLEQISESDFGNLMSFLLAQKPRND